MLAFPFLAGKPLPRRVTKVHKGFFWLFSLCAPSSPWWWKRGSSVSGGKTLTTKGHKGTQRIFLAFFPLCPFVSLVVEKRLFRFWRENPYHEGSQRCTKDVFGFFPFLPLRLL